MVLMLVTRAVSHEPIGWLNSEVLTATPPHQSSPSGQSRNRPCVSVTSDTSQSGMSTHPALLHRAKLRSAQFGSVEQHASPLGTADRHATTASLSAASSGNAHGVSPADTSSPVSNFCFLPFYLSTSSRPSQSSVVFLEVESRFYLVILVSFSTSG